MAGFIDFDLSERNVRLFDPCYCATGILSEQTNEADEYEKCLDVLKGIINGYDNVIKLTRMNCYFTFYY